HHQPPGSFQCRRLLHVGDERDLALGVDATDQPPGAADRPDVGDEKVAALDIDLDTGQDFGRGWERLHGRKNLSLALAIDLPDALVIGNKKPLLKRHDPCGTVEPGGERDRLVLIQDNDLPGAVLVALADGGYVDAAVRADTDRCGSFQAGD